MYKSFKIFLFGLLLSSVGLFCSDPGSNKFFPEEKTEYDQTAVNDSIARVEAWFIKNKSLEDKNKKVEKVAHQKVSGKSLDIGNIKKKA